MVLDEMNALYNPWIILQQPSHASIGITASFRSLLAAIDQGWQVEEPVQAMPTIRKDTWTYCFVLRHPIFAQTCRLYAPMTPQMERYVERNHYQVIEGSFIENL